MWFLLGTILPVEPLEFHSVDLRWQTERKVLRLFSCLCPYKAVGLHSHALIVFANT